jgi:multicomponent Na+:H+ antiporter subunit C
MTLALAVALLTGVGTFLVVRGGAVRLILGFILLGHAANLVIIAAGGTFRREAPLVDGGASLETMADPLPQAFVLTAIVITFGVTVYLLSLVARTARKSSRTDSRSSDEPSPTIAETVDGGDRHE